MQQNQIGLIGLAVMGQNLALNLAEHGFRVGVYNRSCARTDAFMESDGKAAGISAYHDLSALVQSLERPRKLLLMVKAGDPVDALIEQLRQHLSPDDIIIDGGNAHFQDTIRRVEYARTQSLRLVGCGISGGEEGARNGPSIMPGGDAEAWPHIKDMLQAIAAQVDGVPCCQWVGEGGAGHFVKMVHNGIEYGDMQLIAESYDFMRFGLGLSLDEIQARFARWNQGVLDSYLIEITAKILGRKDDDGQPLLDKIRDSAGQKGTGTWTAISALQQGVPLTLISEAVFARGLSSFKDEREQAELLYRQQSRAFTGDREALLSALESALYAAKIVSYAQGYMLMREASSHYDWNLAFGDIALLWRGGCIIRSRFLNNIKDAFMRQPDLRNLLLDDFFRQAIQQAESGWRSVLRNAVDLAIPMPAMASALTFVDGYRRGRSPANLIQAQRDYFGAHTYERLDRPRGEYFHTEWI